MNIDDLFPSKYLRGADLQGKAVAVRINNVVLEEFYDNDSRQTVKKAVLYCDDKSKGIVLSKSLSFQIADILHSKNTNEWIGKDIVLYSDRRLVFGVEKDVLQAKAKG
jgi:hypothetical protein